MDPIVKSHAPSLIIINLERKIPKHLDSGVWWWEGVLPAFTLVMGRIHLFRKVLLESLPRTLAVAGRHQGEQ